MTTLDLSAARWRKSSRSPQGGDECVEVAGLASGVGVRDSKDPDGPKLLVDRAAFAMLAGEVRAGRSV